MGSRLVPSVPPEAMTPKARQYLLITALYFFLMGLSMLLSPERFSSPSFEIVANRIPFGLDGWATIHLLTSLLALHAARVGREKPAWLALIIGAGILGAWTYGFFVALQISGEASVSPLWAYGALTLYHLTQARQPLRAPFDPLIRSMTEK